MNWPRRVFLGPTEIAGYYSGLARGLEQLGVETVQLDLGGHSFAYRPARPPKGIARLVANCAGRRASTRRRAGRGFWRGLQAVLTVPLFVRLVVTCDLFVFGYASSLFRLRELPLLRLLRRRIVFVFHGSDSRAPYLDGSEMATERGISVAECIALTRKRKARLRHIERYADAVIANPLSAHLHERPIVPFAHVGIPALATPPADSQPRRPGPVQLLHAPSHPAAKGSDEIRAAVERLRAAGVELELIEVRAQPNEVVLGLLRACDAVVDQVYADTPMAGFSAEAAAYSKPAIIGGYAWHELLGDDLPPTHRCMPDELDAAIERLALDDGYRRELGTRAHEFVSTVWAAREVARRLLEAAAGEGPRFDPSSLRYCHGAGFREAEARRLIGDVLALGGPAALQVADKPELERALVAFAEGAEA